MIKKLLVTCTAVLVATSAVASERITTANYVQAQTEYQARLYAEHDAFGKFNQYRKLVPIDKQGVVRMNRDTLYSFAVVDLSESPAYVIKPDTNGKYQSIEIMNQYGYAPMVLLKPGEYKLTQEEMGSRYAIIFARTLVNENDPDDAAKVMAAQDGLKIKQEKMGTLDGLPKWDEKELFKIRDAIANLAQFQPEFSKRFGPKSEVDPIQFFVQSASGWGALPTKNATYKTFYPEKNEGMTPYSLTFTKPPVNAFWSITIYDEKGYIIKNEQAIYVRNDRNSTPNKDGSYTIHFGGDKNAVNYMPIEGVKGWNYTVRLYEPKEEILNGTWVMPPAVEVK